MAEFHRKKSNGYKRSYPGCMGGMVNLFDLGVSGNKLLADRPHRHGSDLSGSRLEISKKAPDPTVYDDEYLKEKPQIAYEPRRGSLNKTSNGTPMKMLLAQELSKEMDPKRNPPSVVARLMGLDAVPAQAPVSGRQKNKADGFLESTTLRNHEHCRHLSIELDNFNRSRSGPRYQCREHDSEMKRLPDRSLSHSSISEKEECKDVYEVWQSSKMEKIGHGSLQKATYDDLDEKKMDVVRQKFMEAKRLATDEKLRQSKEFQDALEVLSSNRDLFLKFLQESNPLFSKQLNNLQTVEPPLQSKRITVLKPSKKVARNGSWEQLKVGERCVTSESKTGHFGRTQELVHHSPNKQLSKAKGLEQNRVDRNSVFENQNGFHIRPPGKAESASRPTKIVVLKPSARMTQDIRTAISSPPLSPGPRGGDSFSSSPEEYCDSAAEENNDSQGIEGAHMPGSIINQAMHAFGTRDEPMISSNLSNGYVGDESSFNRSDNEYVEGGNLSDSDVMTPTSRHSWEFINRCSPYSSSSLSRASCSPESSVSREAKKRLSERWALIACGNPEYRHLRRSSSTLGEMLAIPEVKNPTDSVGETSEESPSMSSGRMHAQNDVQEASFVSSDKVVEDGAGEGSFRNLLRSRSVPSSSNAVDSVPSEGEASKAEVQMPLAKTEKPKSGKSFRGKVSSLFFSKNRKSSKEKCLPSPSPSSESCQANKEIYNGAHDLQQPPVRNNRGDGQSPLQSSDELCRTPASTLSPNGQKGGGFVKAEQGDIPSENADQPSPVSVLEPPFEDELSPTGVGRSISESEARHGSLSLKMGTSRISPESLATILSWDDPIPVDGRLGKNIGPEAATIASMVVEEEQRFLFVENVLTAAGLDGKQPATTVFLERWHSPSSPLDPSLLDSFDDWNERFININAAMSEAAKLRRAVLERKLLFDCMNAALLDMAGPALDVNPWLRARIWTGKGMTLAGNQLVEEVWRRVKKIFSGEEAVSTGVTATESRDCVDKLLKKEVAGREWDWLQLEWVEVDVIGKEIENDLFKNLIDDIVSDFVRMRLH